MPRYCNKLILVTSVVLLSGCVSGGLRRSSDASQETRSAAPRPFPRVEAREPEDSVRLMRARLLATRLSDETKNHMMQREHICRLTEICSELKTLIAPSTMDADRATTARCGHWLSPRHGYEYKRDGTWRMTGDGETTAGRWRIKGNTYFSEHAISGERGHLIILLDSDYFIYTDGTEVFIEWRNNRG